MTSPARLRRVESNHLRRGQSPPLGHRSPQSQGEHSKLIRQAYETRVPPWDPAFGCAERESNPMSLGYEPSVEPFHPGAASPAGIEPASTASHAVILSVELRRQVAPTAGVEPAPTRFEAEHPIRWTTWAWFRFLSHDRDRKRGTDGVPGGNRTPVAAVRTRLPGPLEDRDKSSQSSRSVGFIA